jgi:hypothetical protein
VANGLFSKITSIFTGSSPRASVGAPPVRAIPGGGMPKPKPQDLAYEIDYQWRRSGVSELPERVHYRDLPIISGGSVDCVRAVSAAMDELGNGMFWAPARLCDDLIGDDRIGALLETRVEALASLPIESSASPKARAKVRAQDLADQVADEWPTWFAPAEVKKLHTWGLNLGFGIGELIWDTDRPSYWTPRLKTWDLRYAYWRWDTRSFWLNTMDGPIEVRPGDGHWVVYAPHGYARSWTFALARPFSPLYLMRRFSERDWARWCEVHGMPIRLGIVPFEASAKAKEGFIRDLINIGREAVIRAEQSGEKDGPKFDVKLIEAASQSWEGFKALLSYVDECCATRALGQNLTTTVKGGGSYAAANVHDRVRLERTESDAQSLGGCLTAQAVVPWAVYNYGAEELAPRVTWSTRPPEDRAATAKTWVDLGNALKAIDAARQKSGDKTLGLNLDLKAIATSFRLPLVDGAELVEKAMPVEKPGAGLGSHEPEEDADIEPAEKQPDSEKPEPDKGDEA